MKTTRLEPSELDALYLRYGFEAYPFGTQEQRTKLRVYVVRDGYFQNADVVLLDPNATETAKLLCDQLGDIGFAARRRHFSSVEAAATQLFDGHFATRSNLARLASQYERFVDDQSHSLGNRYSYVSCPYETSGGTERAPAEPIIGCIRGLLASPGTRLILIEAAAGFGKTCTAYELLHHLVSGPVPQNVIFTELSRNRQAQIFRYVLLDEIDRNYPALKSELVQSEIHSGRIPLIVDGFDELLYRKRDASFIEAETMLDTIGELLGSNAKIVLTTRKTAIFTGDDFHQWMETRSSQFEVTRITLQEPSVVDWLGRTKLDSLDDAQIPINKISNPVLLTYLRNLDDDAFAEVIAAPDCIIDEFFTSLLRREQQRQHLTISPDEQLVIFRNLASSMLEMNFKAESRDVLRDLIAEYNKPILETARKAYSSTERPTLEQLADKLAGHALLDRTGRRENAVSFVNDFVFGVLLGDVISSTVEAEWVGPEDMIEMAVTAYRTRAKEAKLRLWNSLFFALNLLPAESQLSVDIALTEQPARPFVGASFERLELTDCRIGNHELSECLFSKCTFRRVVFEAHNLRGVGFLNCRFFDCVVEGSPNPEHPVWAIGSNDESEETVAALTAGAAVVVQASVAKRLQREVLEQFWPPGRPNANLRRAVRTLFLGRPRSDVPEIARAIGELRKLGVISVDGEVATLNVSEHMREIRILLERGE